MHPRVIFDVVFLCLWWLIFPVVLYFFIRARHKPSIISRSYYCTVISSCYSFIWVSAVILQDILVTTGEGFPCFLGLVLSLSHLPFYSLTTFMKAYQILYTFRPELRTPANMRVFDRKWLWRLLAIACGGVLILAMILILAFPSRYIDPLRSDYLDNPDNFGKIPHGGRECAFFQNWYIYCGAYVILAYFTRQIGREIRDVNDYWRIGSEMRRGTKLIWVFNIPFFLLNALAWFNVFDRPAFEDQVCPIAYYFVLYHILTLINYLFLPLMNQEVSLEDVVKQQRERVKFLKHREQQMQLQDMGMKKKQNSLEGGSGGGGGGGAAVADMPTTASMRPVFSRFSSTIDNIRPILELQMSVNSKPALPSPQNEMRHLGVMNETGVAATAAPEPSVSYTSRSGSGGGSGGGGRQRLDGRGGAVVVADKNRPTNNDTSHRSRAVNRQQEVLSVLSSQDGLILFENHARRALCLELVMFHKEVIISLQANQKWKLLMEAIKEELMHKRGMNTQRNWSVNLEPSLVAQLHQPLNSATAKRNNTANGGNSNSTPTLASSGPHHATKPSLMSLSSFHSSAQISPSAASASVIAAISFSSDAEAFYLLHVLHDYYTRYLKRGAIYELNMPHMLFNAVHKMHKELMASSFWQQVQQTVELKVEQLPPPPVPFTAIVLNESTPIINVSPESPSNNAFSGVIMPTTPVSPGVGLTKQPSLHTLHEHDDEAAEGASAKVTPTAPVRTVQPDNSANPRTSSMTMTKPPAASGLSILTHEGAPTLVLPVSQNIGDETTVTLQACTTTMATTPVEAINLNPRELVSESPPLPSGSPISIVDVSAVRVSNSPVPPLSPKLISQQRSHAAAPPSPSLNGMTGPQSQSLLPIYPAGSAEDLALRMLRLFVEVEKEVLALMCSNLYDSFVACADYRHWKEVHPDQSSQ